LYLESLVMYHFVHIHPNHMGKLDPQAIKYIFIGYLPTQKDTNVTTFQQNDSLCLVMSPSMKIHNIFNLIFSEETHALKIRIIHS